MKNHTNMQSTIFDFRLYSTKEMDCTILFYSEVGKDKPKLIILSQTLNGDYSCYGMRYIIFKGFNGNN